MRSSGNDFYGDSEVYRLPGPAHMKVKGDVGENITLDLKRVPKRSVLVKEAGIEGQTNKFQGAYLYTGHSLYDLLNSVRIKKPNQDMFSQVIDLYVIIGNASGDRAVFSWGEIYYPSNRHTIMIATEVARIIPTKTGELWPLPGSTRIVCGHDLLNERFIEKPEFLTVTTEDPGTPVIKDKQPLFSPIFSLSSKGKSLAKIESFSKDIPRYKYETVFYGRGRGIHSTTPFEGVLLKDILAKHISPDTVKIKNGYFLVTGDDGYRAVFTYSEIMNRCDQSEVMVMDLGRDEQGGRFRLFSSADFFSDRAIKAVKSIDYREAGAI